MVINSVHYHGGLVLRRIILFRSFILRSEMMSNENF